MLLWLARFVVWLLFDLGEERDTTAEVEESQAKLACRFILACGNARSARLCIERIAADQAYVFIAKAGSPDLAMALVNDLEETMHGSGLPLPPDASPLMEERLAAYFPVANRPFNNGNGLSNQ